jgi:hypothetical protein
MANRVGNGNYQQRYLSFCATRPDKRVYISRLVGLSHFKAQNPRLCGRRLAKILHKKWCISQSGRRLRVQASPALSKTGKNGARLQNISVQFVADFHSGLWKSVQY